MSSAWEIPEGDPIDDFDDIDYDALLNGHEGGPIDFDAFRNLLPIDTPPNILHENTESDISSSRMCIEFPDKYCVVSPFFPDHLLVPGTPGRRTRASDWTCEERDAYLAIMLKCKLLGKPKGKKKWSFLSESLNLKHGIIRSVKCCEDFWYTQRKYFKAILGHESSRRESQAVSYWDMSRDERKEKKLPPGEIFSLEWCKKMERILAAQEKRSKSVKSGGVSEEGLVGGNPTWLTPLADRPDSVGSHDQQIAPGELHPPTTEGDQEEAVSVRDFDERIVPHVKQLLKDELHPALQRFRNTLKPVQDKLLTLLAPSFEEKVEAEVKFDLIKLLLSTTSCDIVHEDVDLFKQCIKDALSRALPRLSSALQEVAQKQQETLEEELRVFDESREELRRLDERRQELVTKIQRERRPIFTTTTLFKRRKGPEGNCPALKKNYTGPACVCIVS